MQPLVHELQKLTEGVSIGPDGMRARLALLHQALREKSLQQGRKAVGVVMVGPPSAVRAGALPHASTLVSRSNTIAYRQHAHGRGRPTRSASGARDPDWTDTNGRVCLSQIDAGNAACGICG